MERHSSISRSEAAHTLGAVDQVPNVTGPMGTDPDVVPQRDRSAVPWALILAMLILIGVEAGLRLSGWPRRIPYELELDEYFAVAAAIDRNPMPDVVIVGSSRAREAIDLPRFRDRLRAMTGQPLTVANYAVSGGRAYVVDAIVQKLLRAPTRPKLILFGGAERDLSYDPLMHDQASLYWNFADWTHAWRERRGDVLDDLPVVLRNYLGRVCNTLGCREQLRLSLSQWFSRDRGTPGPVAGELTVWQINNSRRSLARSPGGDVRAYVRNITRQFPHAEMVESVDRLAAACHQRGVPLIVFQVPIPRVLAAGLPRGIESKYADVIGAVCQRRDARFIPANELSPGLSDAAFRDNSHLNLSGADRVGDALLLRITELDALNPATTQPSATP